MGQIARMDLHDRIIEVDRKNLVEILAANRERHIEEYRVALAGYREAATKKLDEDGHAAIKSLVENLKRIAVDIETFDPDKPHQFTDRFILIKQVIMSLPVPKSYADMYASAISIANWDVNDTLKLTYAEFECFVRNQWDWTEEFQATNSSYTS